MSVTVHRIGPHGCWRGGRVALPVSAARLRRWYRWERTKNGRDRSAARMATIVCHLPEAVAA